MSMLVHGCWLRDALISLRERSRAESPDHRAGVVVGMYQLH